MLSGIGNIWRESNKKAYSSLSPNDNVLGISGTRRVQIWECWEDVSELIENDVFGFGESYFR